MNEKAEYIQLDPSDQRWMDFVESFPQANIFHHPAWVNLLAECYGYAAFISAVLDENGEICAGLPFLDVKSVLTGRRCVSLPFTDYCFPLYRDEWAFNRLIDSLIELSHKTRCEVRWELPSNPCIQRDTRFVRHTIPLDTDLDSVAKLLHRTQRQNIRTAEKNGIQIQWGKDPDSVEVFYRLHSLTRRRQGTPVQPRRFFDLVYEKLIQQGLGFVLLANLDDQCLAAGLFLNWHLTLAYKYAASNDFGQDLRPNHLINWTAIQWGCENGYRIFDFGRTDSTNEGLRTFKNRWGAEETPLIYSIFTEKPLPAAKNGRITSLMNAVIRKSPTWVGQVTGELLYRHFG